MREILFRGKTKVYNKWVYGWYCGKILNHDMHSTEESSQIIDDKTLYWHTCEPDTVGQFTGLTDKNGKKIFEGDVVNAVIVRDLGGCTENRQETGIIAYDKIGMIGLIAKYAGTIPVWSDFFQELILSGCISDFWFEIIGNIHDNPELLETP